MKRIFEIGNIIFKQGNPLKGEPRITEDNTFKILNERKIHKMKNMLQTMWNIKWILVFVNTFLLICIEGKLHCLGLRGSSPLLPKLPKNPRKWKEHIDRLFAFVNIRQF